MTAPDPGVCGHCSYRRQQTSARGSEFLRCGRADDDPHYPRYPPLPVASCTGFEAADSGRSGPLGPRAVQES